MNEIVNKTDIAILLGVYNGDPYIGDQIDSIINQTYTNWTLYIRDDKSTDNTLAIIKDYSDRFENIVIISDLDGNLGCNGNYFRLLSIVDSDYYMFCNADDYWFPNKIQLSMDRMKLEESKIENLPVIVHTDLTISDHNLKIIANSYWENTNTNPERFKSFNRIGICSVVAGATMLFNKKVKEFTFPVSQYAPFFDHWIALKVVDNGVISSIHVPTISYRQIGTNLAAVSVNFENSFLYKLTKIKKVVMTNFNEAKMLKKIGWGSYLKYVYNKIIVLFILRLGKKYKSIKK